MDLRPAIIFMPQAEPTVAKPTVGKPVVKVDGKDGLCEAQDVSRASLVTRLSSTSPRKSAPTSHQLKRQLQRQCSFLHARGCGPGAGKTNLRPREASATSKLSSPLLEVCRQQDARCIRPLDHDELVRCITTASMHADSFCWLT